MIATAATENSSYGYLDPTAELAYDLLNRITAIRERVGKLPEDSSDLATLSEMVELYGRLDELCLMYSKLVLAGGYPEENQEEVIQ